MKSEKIISGEIPDGREHDGKKLRHVERKILLFEKK
jgi:hypothetical protein